MASQETVGSIDHPYNSHSGGAEGPKFIRCVDGREPQIHEVSTFSENDVTRELHPTARVDVGAKFVGEFVNN